jgi:molybdenum cofactor biosynthesis enzyme
MVDVSDKPSTVREAVAEAVVLFPKGTIRSILDSHSKDLLSSKVRFRLER